MDVTMNELLTSDRVQITYSATKGDKKGTEVELPLRIMVIGDFLGHASQPPFETRSPISINQHNLNQVLTSSAPQINITVPNFLGLQQQRGKKPLQELDIALTIQSMDDFTPDNIVKQIPELSKLVTFRQLLVRLKQEPNRAEQIIGLMLQTSPEYCLKFLDQQISYFNQSREDNND